MEVEVRNEDQEGGRIKEGIEWREKS